MAACHLITDGELALQEALTGVAAVALDLVGAAEVIFLLAKDFKQTRFTVPDDFPAGVFDKLFELGLDLADLRPDALQAVARRPPVRLALRPEGGALVVV